METHQQSSHKEVGKDAAKAEGDRTIETHQALSREKNDNDVSNDKPGETAAAAKRTGGLEENNDEAPPSNGEAAAKAEGDRTIEADQALSNERNDNVVSNDEPGETAAKRTGGCKEDNDEASPNGAREKPKISASEPFEETDFKTGLYQFILRMGADDGRAKATGDLQRWIDHQNACRRRNQLGQSTDLTDERVTVLNRVGFPWKLKNDERWERRFDELVAYHKRHGNCRVPRGTPGLGEWVNNMRKVRARAGRGDGGAAAASGARCLTPEREARLDAIGFEWNLKDWDGKFDRLRKFAEERGHCDVRLGDGDRALFKWVAYQRKRYRDREGGKKNAITDEQIEKLEGVGFQWKASNKGGGKLKQGIFHTI